MNKITSGLIILFVILITVLLFYNNYIDSTKLDNEICNNIWNASPEFCDQAGITYMVLFLDLKSGGYLVYADGDDVLYNGPFTIKSKLIENTNTKGKYQIQMTLDSADSPFPDDSTLVVDRVNKSLSIYKDDKLYGHLTF